MGSAVAARIVEVLAARRPDIPILVVAGRSAADGPVGGWPGGVHRMAATADPRAFYRVARAVLVPSTWRESFGRVAAEALANGLPVLASDRGALPETLGDAGFVLALPPRCTAAGGEPTTAREVAPWIALVERLWDDPAFEASHRERALREARRWDADAIAARYHEFFGGISRMSPWT
jgi:glycosyltransferase involved in cell wall biosynthesis